ncbi:Na+/H+-dicarboxylate symporter [Chishuiella changwenlii]|uniref:Na+/H+-dicarboxylate symporter n=1 Tax=Chishuiella changwenlii TaxID=1434701 RepID=A0A1M6Z6E3_9FLAO|nr:dicarboxylate/amino acid:cation symporter [Chishuiella changwenlii]GGE87076.1 sodium:dicarboxylate symporter [Chishuiella changwenlii]SHL25997.1 Na+/H+-dicarboxylate symporter [Chishuiella changwenlii]
MKIALHWRILIGIISGIILGISLNYFFRNEPDDNFFYYIKFLFKYVGSVFVKLLKMLVVPLVMASIYMSIVSLENIAEIGKIGKKTIMYYMLTTALAVLMGIVVVNIIQPGNVSVETASVLKKAMNVPDKVSSAGVGDKSSFEIVVDTLVGMIPDNPFNALATTNVLQVIFFSIFIAIIAVTMREKSEPFNNLMKSVDALMQKGVVTIMGLAPYFLFFLVGGIFMQIGIEALLPLLKYAFTVLLGLLVHGFIILPLVVWIFTKENPYKYLLKMMTPLLTAWSTSSSAATLPVTMKTVEKIGVSPKISNFVLPLGATINMDGTALYESVAVIFIAGLLGVPLDFGQQVVIFLTASLAAMGAAAIPGAGLVTMGIVLSAVGLPLEAIGIILAVDALLDQFRTTINVWGDITAAIVINKSEKNKEELEESILIE